ncbi:MAG: endo alpha-1,4 polygalactosaminidase [Solirubrobacterales bacterium]
MINHLIKRLRRRRPAGAAIAAVLTAGLVAVAIANGARDPAGSAAAASAASKNERSAAIAGCRGCRRPPLGYRWQYRLQGVPDISRAPNIYVVDGFDTSSTTVRRIHRAKGYAVCYVNAGAWENWRGDRGSFPSELLGDTNGWPGERFLDIRKTASILPIMRKRFDLCRRKGFDAVEPDNVDAYLNDSGFPLTSADQLAYNRAIAREVHNMGLAVALKNDLEQAARLGSIFDFAIVEQCVEYDECDKIRPFTLLRKAVLVVEYNGSMRRLCATAERRRFSGLMQTLDLDRPGTQCPRRG